MVSVCYYAQSSIFLSTPVRRELMRPFVLAFIASLIASFAVAQPDSSSQLNLMPIPSQVQMGTGNRNVNRSFTVALTGYKEPRLESAVGRFLTNLSHRTGLQIGSAAVSGEKATLVINTNAASKEVQEPGEDESYTLEITPSGAKLTSANPLGALHGLQTFMQLVDAGPSGFVVPAVSIHDTPRFVWRGLLIDVGRHFIPIDVIKRNLDGMEAIKMNVLHWHLSDYQGFRVESKKFPKLQELGSDGQFYTQAEIRDLIAYARDRGIRVVPEFDMPGHSTSWFVGYPELASAAGPYQIERHWGVFDPAMDPTRDAVYDFLDDFIHEMADLFPDPYFHIGGDEVNGKQWDANPKIQEFKRTHNLKTNQELQAYFTTRVQKIVSKHHKQMVGWDEILTPGVPKEIVIQSWRGPESLAAAAKEGYRGLLSNGYYIDLMWSAERHYVVDPLSGAAASLTSEQKQNILGGEAAMWGEYVNGETIDSRIWPRTAAIAERLWSPQDVRDIDSMYRRMDQISWHLDSLGLTHNTDYVPMLQRIADTPDASALRVLADVVEPVKDYDREQFSKVEPTSLDPLNRLVDVARPESARARNFSALVEHFVSGHCKDVTAATQVRASLIEWRDNDAKLQPLLSHSFLLSDVGPISRQLSAVAASGLQALDQISRGHAASPQWKVEQIAIIAEAEKPTPAQLLLMVAPPIQRLVEAATAGGVCAGR
jgi:hexosaminidase